MVDDGRLAANAQLAERFGARYLSLGEPRGLNAARNAGIEAADGELLAFIDDDVEVHDGWLDALIAAAHSQPEVDVFTGPIVARFEGVRRRVCGREGPPITHNDYGDHDRDVPRAWGANLTIRRDALDPRRLLRPPPPRLERRRGGVGAATPARRRADPLHRRGRAGPPPRGRRRDGPGADARRLRARARGP